ncbi:hypothetical protein BA190_27430 [Labrys sp. WJW]|uniref:tyrosine-type recombinase/integrase n=1 Tax=Labrys sp. WJW TaxID=1737983 RepID=UPI000833F518|nr:tyrosine-type recombinase/integrase [Labrys sp. WJW]OCC01696.1 hypothetical protein BA190_27430 [Labrys sp. WJW]
MMGGQKARYRLSWGADGKPVYTLMAAEPPRVPGKTLLMDQLDALCENQWKGRRSMDSMRGQGKTTIVALSERFAVHYAEDVTKEHIKALVSKWEAEGIAKSTVTKRLIVLKQMGIDRSGVKAKGKVTPKWALNESTTVLILAWLRDPKKALASHRWSRHEDYRLRCELADHIEWTCLTGLRVEESLRQVWGDITFKHDPETNELSPKGMVIMVDGTKTQASRAPLPLSEDAGRLLIKRHQRALDQGLDSKIFPQSYRDLADLWRECRKFLGVTNPTCTLKALRRSAARYLHTEKGMPLDILRQYLRHENVETTMGYLKIAGGYNTEQIARFL